LVRDKTHEADGLSVDLKALQAQCVHTCTFYYNRFAVYLRTCLRYSAAVKNIEELNLERAKMQTDLLKLQVCDVVVCDDCV
jgi:hypothetical protein